MVNLVAILNFTWMCSGEIVEVKWYFTLTGTFTGQ